MKLPWECEMRFVDSWLVAHPGAVQPRVLDAGCGFAHGLVTRYRGRLNVLGMDVNPETIRMNHDVSWKIAGDATRIPAADASFDLVFCRDVVEHLPDPALAFREFARVLKPNGVAVVTTVNVLNPGNWAIRVTPRWLRKAVRSASFGEEFGDNAPTFHLANTATRLRQLAAGAGLEVEGLEMWPSFMWYFRFLPAALYGIAAGNRVLQVVGLRWLFGGLTIGLRRPAPAGGTLPPPTGGT